MRLGDELRLSALIFRQNKRPVYAADQEKQRGLNATHI